MRRVDLTGTIEEGMWSFGPPLPEVRVRRLASLTREGWDAHLLHFANIQGTCVETAAHFNANTQTIDQVPVERFFARAAVFQLPDKGPRDLVTLADLEGAGVDLQPGMAALIATGWDRMWNHPRFFWDSPNYTREAIDWLAARRPAMFGVDVPSVDSPYRPNGLLNVMFATGALLLAPLVNLRQVSRPYVDLVAMPLLVAGVCGAPCRAVVTES